jgi:hypothetical protein
MQNINSTAELKNEIQFLEVDLELKGKLLNEQFHLTYESLKPVNILKRTMNEVSSSPYLIDNILSTGLGLATGYISRKIVIGSSGNIFRKLIGSVLQFGVTNIIAQNPVVIKTVGQFIIQHIFSKKLGKPQIEDERLK